MSNDQQLLHEYATSSSREALEELIHRNLPLVYSAALRQVRDSHLAEDVTQAVFLVLSRKAKTIRRSTALGSWLLTVTRYTAVNAMKKQTIHLKYEMLAARPESVPISASDWDEIAPRLDAQLNRLARLDRDAVVLRFFQDRSFAQIGAELGLTEEAARKRVARALERLRSRLGTANRSIDAGALGLAIGAYAVQAIPKHLVAGAIAASIGNPTPQCVVLAKGAIKMIAWTKAKLIGAVATSVILGSTGVVMLTRARAEEPAAVAQQAHMDAMIVAVPTPQPAAAPVAGTGAVMMVPVMVPLGGSVATPTAAPVAVQVAVPTTQPQTAGGATTPAK